MQELFVQEEAMYQKITVTIVQEELLLMLPKQLVLFNVEMD